MGKFDGILICTDLDGTLYKKDKTVSQKNKDAIEYFKSEGGYFSFITGRLPYYSMNAFNEAMPNVPFGCINGGGLYDGFAKEYIWTTPISQNVFELVAFIDKSFSDIGIQACAFDKTYFVRENEAAANFRKITGLYNHVKKYDEIDEPIAKIIFSNEDDEVILAVEKALKSHPLADSFSFIRSEKALFEILPKGVDKGLALKKLTEHLKVDISKTLTIGEMGRCRCQCIKGGA